MLSRYSDDYKVEGNKFTINVSKNKVQELADEPSVKILSDFFPEKRTHNSVSRDMIGVDKVNASSSYNLTGLNVVVAEWDQGWAGNHDDLAGRLTVGDTGSSVLAHATHVAGTILGNGTLTYANRGMAPRASLITYEWFDDKAEFNSEYTSAIGNDAVISQNSWGYSCSNVSHLCCLSLLGEYYDDNVWVDNATRGEQDNKVTIVWSAGNERSTGNDYCGSLGYTYNTTTPMGSSKNTITVGAVADNKAMSTFSSWGPTVDGRLKPDVVANGVGVTSTVPTDTYTSSDGTSMAAPAVSGGVALLYEQYKRLHNNQTPEPALIKALLIQTTEDLGNSGPDFQFGWGLVNITKSIEYMNDDVNNSLFIVDNITSTSNNKNYTFDLDSGNSELRITLVWNDYPGDSALSKQLINDLDLVVTNSSGDRIFPIVLDHTNPSNLATQNAVDTINNVEQVNISSPDRGTYTVMVNGSTVPYPNQLFAIVTNVYDEINPVWSNALVSDEFPVYNQSLQFNITFNDSVGLSNYIFSWNDSTNWVNYSNGSLSGKNADAIVNVTVTANTSSIVHWKFYINDSANNWNTSIEYNFTVLNAQPEIVTITISSSDLLNRTNGTITADYTFTDADGDNFTNQTKWYNNTMEIGHLGNLTSLSTGNTSKGENWTFSVRSFDGTNYSSWSNISIYIRNALPNINASWNITVNESKQLNFTVNITDIDLENVNISINDSRFVPNNFSGIWNSTFVFRWNTTVNDSGYYVFNITVNDSEEVNSILLYGHVVEASDSDGDGDPDYNDTDDDNDGLNDTVDYLIGNSSDVNTTIVNITVEINGSSNISKIFNSSFIVNITENNETLVEFNWTFNSSNQLNLYNMTIVKEAENSSNTSILVGGINLANFNKTKTVIFKRRINGTGLCIKDREISSINNITLACTGIYETWVACPGISGRYNCSFFKNSTRYKVSGLNHSGVREQAIYCGDGTCSTGESCSSCSTDCGNCASTSSSSSGGGGGGGGGLTLVNDPDTLSNSFVGMKKNVVYTLDGKRTNLAVTKLSFGVKRSILKGQVTVNVTTLPSSITKPSNTYQTFQITPAIKLTKDDVVNAEIEFRVKNSWSKDMVKVSLLRYNNRWDKLSAELVSKDDEYSNYKALLPGFSYFAVVGEKKAVEKVVHTETADEEENVNLTDYEEELEEDESKGSLWYLWIVLIIIIVFLVSILFIRPVIKEKKRIDEMIKEEARKPLRKSKKKKK
jgi:PGF-pre-PGF domain-containing protein